MLSKLFGNSILKNIKNIFTTIVVILTVLVALSFFETPWGYKILATRSGSMEPAVKVGSLVVIKKAEKYQQGDIVTFSKNTNTGKLLVTHRIHAVESESKNPRFVTKGDANEDPDAEPVSPDQILGKVVFSIPFLGYPITFAKTTTGLIVLIIIPATIVVYSEILVLKREVGQLLEERGRKDEDLMDLIAGALKKAEKAPNSVKKTGQQVYRWAKSRKEVIELDSSTRRKLVIILALLNFLLILLLIQATNSQFFDTETSTGNTLTADCWDGHQAVQLDSPDDGATTIDKDVTFSWQESSSICADATLSYKFEAYNNASLNGDPVYESSWQMQTEYTVSSIADDTYYWQVITKDQLGYEKASNSRELNVESW